MLRRVFNVLKLWIEKFWFDFLKDCPALANKTVEWLEVIIGDPANGGGTGPEYSGSAKVAAGLRDKLLRKLVTPENKPVCIILFAVEVNLFLVIPNRNEVSATGQGTNLQRHF